MESALCGPIERLKGSDYDELLSMLNQVFHKTAENSFEVTLPVMWERTDERVGRHLAIRRDGKIAAVVGVYPLPAEVAGERVLFGTIGNVATLPEYRNQGLMRSLMEAALREAEAMGMDAARLCGLRQRYNRYGFENAGTDCQYTLTDRNLRDYYGGPPETRLSGAEGFERRLRFRRALDGDDMRFVMERHRSAPIWVDRGDQRQYMRTMTAYQNEIWLALDQDAMVGYLTVSPDGSTVTEHRALDAQTEGRMLCEWLMHAGVPAMTFHTAPYECALNRYMGRLCEKWTVGEPNHFHIFQWDKLLNALLQIRADMGPIPPGDVTVSIEGWGCLRFAGSVCARTEETPQLCLKPLDAVRLFLGSLPPENTADTSGLQAQSRLYMQSLFPLPLWWCNQDRV